MGKLTKKHLDEARYLINKEAWVQLEQWQDRHLRYMKEDLKRRYLNIAKMGGPARYVGLVEEHYVEPWMQFAMRLTNVLVFLLVAAFAVYGIAALIKNLSTP